jgi:hypothetical protein
LQDRHGKDEADGLILDRRVVIRPHPLSKQYFQFLDGKEAQQMTKTKQEELQVEQKGCLKTKQYVKFYKNIANTRPEDLQAAAAPDFSALAVYGYSCCNS